MSKIPRPVRSTAAGRPIRFRLLTLALFPLGTALPALLFLLATWGDGYLNSLLVGRVQSDLNVASSHFERVSGIAGNAVGSLAGSAALARQLGARAPGELRHWLDAVRREHRLDFLELLDSQGCPTHGPCFAQGVIDQARQGHSRTEAELFSPERLVATDPALAERALTPILSTANATPDDRVSEPRGLVIHTAAPVLDALGNRIAILSGGVLLNRNLDFIDELNALVYPAGSLPFGSVGTATLFLGDVRIATNVRLFEGERAIGTRVSAAVRSTVLDQGNRWLDRAFVVSDWYVSGYRPLMDGEGRRIGMLYVGFLEKPFVVAKYAVLSVVLALFAGALIITGFFSVRAARRLFQPIERMHATMNAIEAGDANARVGKVGDTSELIELAAHLDRLIERQNAQSDALKRWGESLDSEVARRTAELEQALADLRSAQGQLVTNEKMAAIGQLTAGVAHEINNPIAVIQGNLEVAREVLGEAGQPVEPELRLIQEQVHRIRLIVAKLLQFARPQDFVGYLEPVSPSQLVQDCLLLVGHQLRQGHVAIEQQFDSQRAIICNRIELQQVVINLLVNAIQAMPQGGAIRLISEDWDEDDMPVGLRLIVADSGHGLRPGDIDRLFEPFFTTGKAEGHGLGLWVSRTLIERYGGRVTAEPNPGGGARFIVWLRCEPLD